MLRIITASIVTVILANLKSIPVRKRDFVFVSVTCSDSFLSDVHWGGGGGLLYVRDSRIRRENDRPLTWTVKVKNRWSYNSIFNTTFWDVA
jgi:hypothetical protein